LPAFAAQAFAHGADGARPPVSAQGMHAFQPPYIRGHDRGNLRARGGRESSSSSMKMFLPCKMPFAVKERPAFSRLLPKACDDRFCMLSRLPLAARRLEMLLSFLLPKAA